MAVYIIGGLLVLFVVWKIGTAALWTIIKKFWWVIILVILFVKFVL